MNKKIALPKPIALHGKSVASIELREPTATEHLSLGEPRVLVYSPTNSAYHVEQTAVIDAYIEKCITHELGADILGLLTLDDAMDLKAGLLSFFDEAASRRLSKSSMSSSLG
jgi:hypothetical protein